jgi:hypothetical protein
MYCIYTIIIIIIISSIPFIIQLPTIPKDETIS